MEKPNTEAELINSINKKKNASFAESVKVTGNKSGVGFKAKNLITDSASVDSEKTEEVAEVVKEPAPTNLEAIAELIKNAIAPLKDELSETRQTLDKVTLDNEVKTSEIDSKVSEIEDLKSQLADVSNSLEKAEECLSKTTVDSKVLADLGKLIGQNLSESMPQPLTIQGEGSPALRSFEKLVSEAPVKSVTSSQGFTNQRDLTASRRYWLKNKEEISEGVEAVLKNAGFLQGSNAVVNAPTLTTDIPSVAFTHLSNIIRVNTNPDLIHSQFFRMGVRTGIKPGLNTDIPNYPYFARPTAIADRQLTEGVKLDPTTQPLTQQLIRITIEELGLGKDVNNAPVGLTNFVSSFAIHDLESLIIRNLGYDYQAYKDLRAYSLWFNNSTQIYPTTTGVLEQNTANLVLGDGLITRAAVTNLRALMKANKVQPFMGGYYGMVFNPGGFTQYIQQLSAHERYTGAEATAVVNKALIASQQGDAPMGGEVLGFKGLYDGFFMFEQNSYGVGAFGTDIGVNDITLTSGDVITFDSNFAFGADTIACAESLPVEIRERFVGNEDFQRCKSMIWYSHEGFQEMNVNFDPTLGTEQRVFEIRNRRTI